MSVILNWSATKVGHLTRYPSDATEVGYVKKAHYLTVFNFKKDICFECEMNRKT